MAIIGDTGRRAASSRYDAFLSYSHAADGLLAPRLQGGLQRFAKPWWKPRAVRVFRDQSSLSANPHLWSSIIEALDASAWFVLLLSEEGANSKWVNREVEYWVAHKDVSRLLPVVTDGECRSADTLVDPIPWEMTGRFYLLLIVSRPGQGSMR
ncbi:MAG: TIR domain-containing protein [Acidimicrobiia bacterium]